MNDNSLIDTTRSLNKIAICNIEMCRYVHIFCDGFKIYFSLAKNCYDNIMYIDKLSKVD